MTEKYSTKDTALLLVDLLNDFLDDTFLTDAVAEFTEEAHNAALTLSYPTFGHEVTTIGSFLAAVEPV
jgi:nicotinamidase-related amidase